jgi:oligoribonuclease
MTGLTIKTDRLLEVACIITDGNLEPLDEGVSYVIKTEKSVLDEMGEWCVRQHGESGLTAACQDDSIARHHADVRAAVLAYIRDRVPKPMTACLAGNTVHADAVFLKKEMPELIQHLHYRIVDVSSVKELVARWYGETVRWSQGKGSHRALDDIQGSISELKYYRTNFFVKP